MEEKRGKRRKNKIKKENYKLEIFELFIFFFVWYRDGKNDIRNKDRKICNE